MSGSTPLSLAQLTAAELRSTQWRSVVPEVYALQTAVENNSGHRRQNVLDHTIGVMAGMETVVQGQFLTAPARATLTAYLNQKLTDHTYLELLRLAVLTHDLAKGETLVTDDQGMTRCPAHEILAVGKIPQFQARFGLTAAEVERVQAIVRVHDTPHNLLGLVLAKPEMEAQLFEELVTAIGETVIEVVILVYADILGGNLAQINPTEFKNREKLCQTWLDRVLRSAA